MTTGAILWTVFGAVVVVVLALDLGVFHRKAHEIGFREALLWSGVWVGLAMAYTGLVWWLHPKGASKALEFLTAYLVEESLSVDNLFVFLLIFSYFAASSQYQHNVLFWGILGAMVFRAVFIVGGVALIQTFHWFLYVFGAILIVSGAKMAVQNSRTIAPEKNPMLKLFRRFVPVATDYAGTKFFIRRDGRLLATPLFVVLLVLETTDIVFAVDSIPAVLGITAIRSWCTRPTSLRSWGCGRCTSCWRVRWSYSITCASGFRRCWCSSARRCCSAIGTKCPSVSRFQWWRDCWPCRS